MQVLQYHMVMYVTISVLGTSHSFAALTAGIFVLEVVVVSITATISEAETVPVQRVVIPACVTGPTGTCVGGLRTLSWRH